MKINLSKPFAKIKKLPFIPLFFLISVIFFTFLISNILAAGEGTVGAYPTNFDPSNPKTKSWFIYELKPGQSKEDSITVVNNSEKGITVKVYPVDATTTRDGAFALFNEDQRQTDVGAWVNVSKEIITIEPKGRKEVPFTISIPKYASVGDHAGGIIVQEVKKPNAASKGMGLSIVSRVGTRIYQTVPGTKVSKLDISNFNYNVVDDKLVFDFTLTNRGNVILTPTGNLEIKESNGKLVEGVSVENLGSVFPGKPTKITVKAKKSAPLFGMHKATVTVNYTTTKAVSKTITFFIYIKDWRFTLIIPVLILLMVLLISVRKVHSHWSKMNRMRQIEIISPPPGSRAAVTMTEKIDDGGDFPTSEKNIDGLFIAHHIKLLIALIIIAVLTFSVLFAFILQYFILKAPQVNSTPVAVQNSSDSTKPEPTKLPAETPVPLNKLEIKVAVLNGSGVPGAAKLLADKLTLAGFTITKTDNALLESEETIVSYPSSKSAEMEVLINEVRKSYPQANQQISTTSASFTITIGKN